jgi:hypothetical protein
MESRLKKIIKKVINEMDLRNLDDVIKYTEYLNLFKKEELKKITKFLFLIRDLGVVNMFQSGMFLLMGKQYFDDFMRLKSYEHDYDEDIVNELSELINEIRDIMIRAGIKMVESNGKEVTPKTVESAMRRIAESTIKHYIKGNLPR